jgi:hypothetical protein
MIRLDEKLPQLTKNARLTLGAVSAGNYNALAEGCKKRVDLSNVSHNGELSNNFPIPNVRFDAESRG